MRPAQENTRKQFSDAWESAETPATVLIAIIIDLFSDEALQWEPETLREALDGAIDVSPAQREVDRFMSLKTALMTDMCYTDVTVFHHTMNALNGSQAVFTTWDPVDLDELTWGLTELFLNDRPTSDEDWANRFSPDVRTYIGLLVSDGNYAPGSLPEVVKSVAIMPESVSGDEQYADDPMLYGTAHENSVEAAADAEKYAQARLDRLMSMLDELPFSSRSPDWKASTRAEAAGAAQS